jgi:hypothetical protein
MPDFLKEDEILHGDDNKLVMRYTPLSKAVKWDSNPKQHDLGTIIESIRVHGFRDAPIYDETAGCIVAGNGRTLALQMINDSGSDAPRGIVVDKAGEWWLPIQFGVNASSVEGAYAFGIDHNIITLLGGNLDIDSIKDIWDEEAFADMVKMIAESDTPLTSLDGDDIDNILNSVNTLPDILDQDKGANVRIIIRCENSYEADQIAVLLRSHSISYEIVKGKKGDKNENAV